MIKFDRVEFLHWDIQPHQVLPLAGGVTVLTGENGSGKTSLLDGIKVCLGGELTGDRSTKGYLLKQAAPVAMIRLLVDNRPTGGMGRGRPFDPLGEQSQDVVTLAVVFRTDGESDYTPEYYILDGDVVPLDSTRKYRPLPTRQDFRDRLRKVGIGRQYMKLMCLGQGQIASLCRKKGGDLFDALYDIIGGRDALEAWKQRLLELTEARSQVQATEQDLRNAESKLALLQTRVRRFEEYLDKRRDVSAYRAALPWVRLDAARTDAARRAEEVAAALAERDRELGIALEADLEDQALDERILDVERQITAKAGHLRGLGDQRDAAVARRERAAAKLTELEKLRLAGQGVAEGDLPELRRERERLGVALAQERAAAIARDGRRKEFDRQLESVATGLVPFPPEVEAFRAELRSAGIPHHLLAEIVEVADGAWRGAIEAFLGRHRLAVLVQDPATWEAAAQLARRRAYSHGVLAPDIKGSSPFDQDGLNGLLEVHEPRYRSLVARLVRHVIPSEPDDPLRPRLRGESLSADGFVVSRIEARVAPNTRPYLGRHALEQLRRDAESGLAAIAEEDAAGASNESDLRHAQEAASAAIIQQEARFRWEAARDEHAGEAAALALARSDIAGIDALMKEARANEDGLREVLKPLEGLRGAAKQRAKTARDAAESQTVRLAGLEPQSATASAELGVAQAEARGEPDETVREVLAEELPLRGVESAIRKLDEDLARYSPEERDDHLPLNAERQTREVDAVRGRLEQLASSLDATRVAAEEAKAQYDATTQRVFRDYFGRLREAAAQLDLHIEGKIEGGDDGRFGCVVRVRVGEKPPVHYDSEDLSGGQKAALSILMGMTAVSLESHSAGFFLIDEPFSASDVHKVNELGSFLGRTGAQYLLSMPTSSDIERCGAWLQSTWICTKTPGGVDELGAVRLAPRVKIGIRVTDAG